MDEQRAIACLKTGDIQGLEYLVETYQVQAVQTAYMIVHERSIAEEIVQSAFLIIADKIHQFDAERPFGPWFLRIVINASLLACKRESRQVSLQDDDTSSVPHWLVDPTQSLQELVETAETRQEVLASLQQLSPKQRAALVMRYYLEMTDVEISDALRQPLSTTKWSVHSAKQRLKTLLRSIFSSHSTEPTVPPEHLHQGYNHERE